jgi:tol-pal system protein YbgF
MTPSTSTRSLEPQESNTPPSLAGTPGISPTSAFNLAYNDYLNGRYDLAVTGFQRFLKDFPATSLAPNAYYWMGESYFSLKDYPHATQAFQKVVNDHPRSEKVAPALFKMGVVTAEAGDLPKARGYLRRVIEDFSTSDEAKLAKNKLAEIR